MSQLNSFKRHSTKLGSLPSEFYQTVIGAVTDSWLCWDHSVLTYINDTPGGMQQQQPAAKQQAASGKEGGGMPLAAAALLKIVLGRRR